MDGGDAKSNRMHKSEVSFQQVITKMERNARIILCHGFLNYGETINFFSPFVSVNARKTHIFEIFIMIKEMGETMREVEWR